MKGEFYKMDFRAWNTGTVDLTLEQEAAYLRLCHAMYDVQGPVPDSIRFLQGIFRCGNVKATALVRQLVEAGKIQRTSDGKLANRRVATELDHRDRILAVKRVAGSLGGRADRVKVECFPSECRVTTECDPTEDEVTGSKPLQTNDTEEACAPGPRSRGEEKRADSPKAPKTVSRKAPLVGDPDGFASWWNEYPRRDGSNPRAPALAKYAWALKQGATSEGILAAARAYRSELERHGRIGTKYVKQARFWLSDRPWEDVAVDTPPGGGDDPYLAKLTDERWRKHVRHWKATMGDWDLKSRTPPPDDPRTKVPKRILTEFELP